MDDPGRSEEKLVFMTCSVLVMLKQDADFQGMPQRRGNMRDDDRRRKRRGKGQQSLEKGIRVLRGRAGGRDQGRESGRPRAPGAFERKAKIRAAARAKARASQGGCTLDGEPAAASGRSVLPHHGRVCCFAWRVIEFQHPVGP